MSDLDQRMRQVLAELELCSTTPAARLERTSASSERGLSLVVDAPNLQRRREEYDAAEGDGERLRVVERAEKALMDVKYGRKSHIDSKQWREDVGSDARKVSRVAHEWNISERMVKRLRAEYRENQAKKAA